jgi:hypothetical protein
VFRGSAWMRCLARSPASPIFVVEKKCKKIEYDLTNHCSSFKNGPVRRYALPLHPHRSPPQAAQDGARRVTQARPSSHRHNHARNRLQATAASPAANAHATVHPLHFYISSQKPRSQMTRLFSAKRVKCGSISHVWLLIERIRRPFTSATCAIQRDTHWVLIHGTSPFYQL